MISIPTGPAQYLAHVSLQCFLVKEGREEGRKEGREEGRKRGRQARCEDRTHPGARAPAQPGRQQRKANHNAQSSLLQIQFSPGGLLKALLFKQEPPASVFLRAGGGGACIPRRAALCPQETLGGRACRPLRGLSRTRCPDSSQAAPLLCSQLTGAETDS